MFYVPGGPKQEAPQWRCQYCEEYIYKGKDERCPTCGAHFEPWPIALTKEDAQLLGKGLAYVALALTTRME